VYKLQKRPFILVVCFYLVNYMSKSVREHKFSSTADGAWYKPCEWWKSIVAPVSIKTARQRVLSRRDDSEKKVDTCLGACYAQLSQILPKRWNDSAVDLMLSIANACARMKTF
jgi:hypothetical protein